MGGWSFHVERPCSFILATKEFPLVLSTIQNIFWGFLEATSDVVIYVPPNKALPYSALAGTQNGVDAGESEDRGFIPVSGMTNGPCPCTLYVPAFLRFILPGSFSQTSSDFNCFCSCLMPVPQGLTRVHVLTALASMPLPRLPCSTSSGAFPKAALPAAAALQGFPESKTYYACM